MSIDTKELDRFAIEKHKTILYLNALEPDLMGHHLCALKRENEMVEIRRLRGPLLWVLDIDREFYRFSGVIRDLLRDINYNGFRIRPKEAES